MFRNVNFSLKEKNNEIILVMHDTHAHIDFDDIVNALDKNPPQSPMEMMMAAHMLRDLQLTFGEFMPPAEIIPTLLQGPEPKEFTATAVDQWFILSLMYKYADAAQRDQLLDSTRSEVKLLLKETPVKQPDQYIVMKTTEFTLPKIPHLALHFVFSMFQIINIIQRRSETINITFSPDIIMHFADAITNEDEKEFITENALDEFFEKNISGDIKNVNKALLNLFISFNTTQHDYDASIEQLKKVSHYWETHPDTFQFLDIFNVYTRLELLYNKELYTPFITNRSTALSERRDTFVSIANKIISTDETINQAERDFQLRCLNLLIKKTLFGQCIGKKAHDGGSYGYHYTEWNFLAHADFELQENGLMRITNITNNAAYKAFYAPGKQNHGVFAEEMKVLFNTLGLTLANTDNLHDAIEFDLDSTKYLKACGVHWTASHVEDLKTKLSNSQASLFRRVTATQVGYDAEDLHDVIRAVHGQ